MRFYLCLAVACMALPAATVDHGVITTTGSYAAFSHVGSTAQDWELVSGGGYGQALGANFYCGPVNGVCAFNVPIQVAWGGFNDQFGAGAALYRPSLGTTQSVCLNSGLGFCYGSSPICFLVPLLPPRREPISFPSLAAVVFVECPAGWSTSTPT